MKTLIDNTQVTSRSYYYLLDYKCVEHANGILDFIKKS
jgi:hypothetical protein